MQTFDHVHRPPQQARRIVTGGPAAAHADEKPSGLILTLQSNQVAVVTAYCRMKVRCLHGGLWITEPPRLQDTVLQPCHPGFELEKRGKAVISAFSPHPFVTLEIVTHGAGSLQHWWRRHDGAIEVRVDILQG